MSSRVAEFAFAVFAAILTGLPITAVLVTALHVKADAAEGCRAEPGDQTPEGKHWYYRIEHPSNRQCWYLRDLGGKPAQAGLADQQPAEKAVAPQAETPPQRSLVDAHAELPWPQPRIEQDATAGAPQQPQAMPAANAPAAQRPNVLESTTRGSLMGTRWPDPSGANSTPSPQPAPSEVVADAQQPDQATPPVQPTAPAAAADPIPAKPIGSLRTLLMVVAGALALAGLTGSVIFRFGARRPARSRLQGRRRVIWDAVDSTRQSSRQPLPPRPSPPRMQPKMPPKMQPKMPPKSQPQMQPRTQPQMQRKMQPKMQPWTDPEEFARRPGFSPSLHEASNPNERLDRISEFFERMSKQESH
jgi:hypothetical protein